MGHRRERTPAMRQKRNHHRCRHGTIKVKPLRWRRVRASQLAPRKNVARARAEADGTHAKVGADIHGHLLILGQPPARAPEVGKTAHPGAPQLGGERPTALADRSTEGTMDIG